MYNIDIPGWFTTDNFITLEKVAKEIPPNGIMVEIGSFVGRSAWAWAKSVDPSITVYCIDIWDDEGWEEDIEKKGWNPEDIFPLKEKFLHYTKDCHNIKTLQSFSPNLEWNNDLIDLCFIDGSKNSVEKFIASFEFWLENLQPSGIMCGHDFHTSSIVNTGVKLMSQKFNKDYTVENNIWIMH